jgi:hypothetical protein
MFNFTAKFLRTAAPDAPETESLDSPSSSFESLNGFSVQSLDSFVKSGSVKIADDKDKKKKDDKDKKEDTSKSKDKPKADKKTEDKPKADKKDEPKEEPKPENDQEFGLGSKYRNLSEEEMQDYAGRIKTKNKDKLDPYTMPYVHHNNIKVVDGAGNGYDLESLKTNITKRPSTLLRQNEKMQHSDGSATQYYNVGLPALKGLAVNEKTGEFVVVDTCPGSGSCKTFCYAMKGSYVMFAPTSMLQTQTLNFLLNDPKGFEERLKAEISKAIAKNSKKNIEVVIRWHDAGDFFSPQYTALAFNVARAFPENDFYAYTKIAAVAKSEKPANFIINFSEGALPSENKQVEMTKIKHSVVVPKDMFYDLVPRGTNGVPAKQDGQVQFRDKAAWDEFKDRLVAKYHIKKDSILSFNQYIKMKSDGILGETPHKWNVVVPPGGGDNSANDTLVLGSYLMFH